MSTLVVRSRKIQFFKISYKNTTYKAVGGGGGTFDLAAECS